MEHGSFSVRLSKGKFQGVVEDPHIDREGDGESDESAKGPALAAEKSTRTNHWSDDRLLRGRETGGDDDQGA